MSRKSSTKSRAKPFNLYLVEGTVNSRPIYKYVSSFGTARNLAKKATTTRKLRKHKLVVVNMNSHNPTKVKFSQHTVKRLLAA